MGVAHPFFKKNDGSALLFLKNGWEWVKVAGSC